MMIHRDVESLAHCDESLNEQNKLMSFIIIPKGLKLTYCSCKSKINVLQISSFKSFFKVTVQFVQK